MLKCVSFNCKSLSSLPVVACHSEIQVSRSWQEILSHQVGMAAFALLLSGVDFSHPGHIQVFKLLWCQELTSIPRLGNAKEFTWF